MLHLLHMELEMTLSAILDVPAYFCVPAVEGTKKFSPNSSWALSFKNSEPVEIIQNSWKEKYRCFSFSPA